MKCSRQACNNEAEGFKHIQLNGNYCRECVKGIDSLHREYVLEHGSVFMTLKSRAECERDRDDLFMLSHPELWEASMTSKRFICVKKRGHDIFASLSDPNAGVGAMVEGDGPVVYLGNILLGQFDIDKVERFDSYEELVKVWEVD